MYKVITSYRAACMLKSYKQKHNSANYWHIIKSIVYIVCIQSRGGFTDWTVWSVSLPPQPCFNSPAACPPLKSKGYIYILHRDQNHEADFGFFSAFFFLCQYTSWKTDSLNKVREHWEEEWKMNSPPLGFSTDPGQEEKYLSVIYAHWLYYL